MKQSAIFLTIILLSILGHSQNANYETLWKSVKNNEDNGLPKSALNVVNQISALAIKDQNQTQFIKTMLFKSKYALVLEEDAQLNIINDFKNQITHSNIPTKNILENILANLYWQYFNQNRWQFYKRTKTNEKVDTNDFRTWDLQTLFDEIHLHYQNSLHNSQTLKLQPLSKYDSILTLQKGSKIYRPTLFDFLSHNALEFYKTNETNITKPAYKFEIDNLDFLGDATTFSNITLKLKDSMSLQLNALKIYQNLIQFHLKDKEPFALADVNIERLKFVNQHATFSNKEALFLDALKTEAENLKAHEVSGLYDFEIASIYYQQGNAYTPKSNEKNRWKTKEAFDICNAVTQKFPKSNAAEKCKVLKSQILQQTLQITTEDFLPIQKHARLLVSYKNIENIQFKIYDISRNQLEKFQKIYRKEEQAAFIKSLTLNTEWLSKLRNENDLQTHSTEVLIPKLPNGTFIIYAETEADQDIFAFSSVQATNFALLEKDSKTHTTFLVIDRNNGKPIQNATVTLTYFKNNDRNPINRNFTTNALGEITIKKESEYYRNISAKISHLNETAYFGDYSINQYHKSDKKDITYNGFLFTDRSIYRPGQTVYFKAIAMKVENENSEVLPNKSVSTILYDVNNVKIKELEFVTNEFGSIYGEFILPSSGLNGEYHIKLDGNAEDFEVNHYFSVEEYKRPKFETKFTPITETYKVNDSVTVKGTALAYAGSNITNAKVVYRVHRKVEYPRWYFWYRPWFISEPQEITHGESSTNDKGEFEITFKALPDQSVDKTSLPIFNYQITADVTDLNGETRSAKTIINVGYHALIANMSIAEKIDKSQKNHNILINTKNLNGEFVPAIGTVKIYKLEAPKSVLRQRPWQAPDYQDFSEEIFKNLFPHDAYMNEDEPANWAKGDLVFEKSFNTEVSKTLELGSIKKWKSGRYIITLESIDKFGQIVKDEVKTTLYSDDDKTLADNQLFSITTNKSTYKVGETVVATLASGAKDLNITVSIEKNNEIVKTEVIQLNNSKKTITIPVSHSDVGGFAVRYSFAVFNSFISDAEIISVPYPKTDLEIETTTFRDKIQPGVDETWSFKIKGPQGDKVSAEILASMYDSSLDQFNPHNWSFNPIQNSTYFSYYPIHAYRSFGTQNFRVYFSKNYSTYSPQQYDQLNWFGFYFGNQNSGYRNLMAISKSAKANNIPSEQVSEEDSEVLFSALNIEESGELRKEEFSSDKEKNSIENNPIEKQNIQNIQIRKNLQETAFFFPQLQTDKEGTVTFSFTTPEALTQWKLQLLAHTKTLESATKTLTTVTQKELMVIPNAPRFLRQGDTITISTKIANLTNNELSGQVYLFLTDAITGKDITNTLVSSNTIKTFTAKGKGNTQVSWNLTIPDGIDAVQYKIIAKSNTFSDGEQNALPVLNNRMLITETLPMWIRSNETKTFTLNKLKTNTSTTLKNHKLSLEITSNPAWYAVQALPYLMEYPYECNEQIFSRFYANALASHISNSNPRIKDVFNQWKTQDVLISNLEKNEELKSILIQETPWLRDAQSETEQKKRIALLFDLNKMNNELQSSSNKLANNQLNNGSWAWFNGGIENRYITQHIIAGFGHLDKLGVSLSNIENSKMIEKAISYLDAEFVKEYNDIRKYNSKVDLTKDHLSYTQLHYLYMRSFYTEIKKSKEVADITKYYQSQIQKYWLSRSLYAKGLMLLVANRMGDKATATKILNSLKENSIISEETGMYWKENIGSWHWYQAPIETQALLIEAFSELENDTKTIDNLKIWLLKNKQTNQWQTTKATTEAIYALLLQGSDWLSVTNTVNVMVGGKTIEPSKLENVKVEAGTDYYKTTWNTSEIQPNMGTITLSKKDDGIAWGGLYWQYFEDLNKISSADTPLKLSKKLFLKTNTDIGEQITEITDQTNLKVGDLIRVRIELRSDRAMEFIHMKDMRAAGLEPINVISAYKWQDGLAYYESTLDASTNFFIDNLPKGIYVFEYDLRVNHQGNMSNGITSIQSMYAPEFSSHSEGVRININNN
ncbi:alpha-2-macroglobulin [Mariniflexile sp.]|uniref:alpha-2-macroglobulin family protein n=1 Tax=Mariniflexile sp. TaxID=1979402 RepID=UPI003562BF63